MLLQSARFNISALIIMIYYPVFAVLSVVMRSAILASFTRNGRVRRGELAGSKRPHGCPTADYRTRPITLSGGRANPREPVSLLPARPPYSISSSWRMHEEGSIYLNRAQFVENDEAQRP